MTLYGARNVEIFLGSLPTGQTLRDANGALNPDASACW
jgi:predicted hotdog family 3-hydroxylacyl-ACP dehydratase